MTTRTMRGVLGIGLLAWLVGLTSALAADPPGGDPTANRELARWYALRDQAWETELREFPLFATQVGEPRYLDRLPEATPAAFARRLAQQRGFLERWGEIKPALLPADERLNFELFGRQLRDQIADYEFEGHLLPITNRNGFHVEFPELPREVPLESAADVRAYIARLNAFSRWVDEHIELMRAGIERGVVLPDVALTDAAQIISPHLVDDPRQSRWSQALEQLSDSIPAAERETLRRAADQAVVESVVPGYRRFLDFLTREYLPRCRTTVGLSALPRGREWYRHRVRQFTTLDVTPAEVHAIGQQEVARIRREMDEVIRQVGHSGDFASFLEHLRTDPRFYCETPDELLAATALVLKRIDGELPKLFGKLPRIPYGIRPVPEFIAPQTTTAYYMPPSGDGRRAGFYYVNTYNLKSRPRYEIEALSLHEAVPGHHLQLALQQELGELPPFRRFQHWTVFVEGWGLYAERLGLEVGFFTDPYSNFGRLSYEMWRACRLVVDTGIHDLGWSRQQAIDFLASNTALSRHNVTAEVDRYIAWPGQALAYKMGELKIRALRTEAEQALGNRFDLRAFHDHLLGAGSIPLDVLEARMRAFIATVPPAAE